MKAVIQRIRNGTVQAEGSVVGRCDYGLLVYLGVEKGDSEEDLQYLAKKISHLRIFEDEEGKMNKSVMQAGGSMLLISQFTLCGDTRKGNRPSFNPAESPDIAEQYLDKFSHLIASCYNVAVETGTFGAKMQVAYTNDGPVTIWMDTRDTE